MHTMTKLVEWLGAAGLFVGVWAYLFISTPVGHSTDFARHFVLFLPFYALLAFAVISVSIIAWRVYTFNDCEEAAKELKQEIEDAKADLRKKGFKIE